jgi:hypothetical protein
MSTRSAVAKPAGDAWTGVYIHSDGYPLGVGLALWELYHTEFAGDLAAMTKTLVDDEAPGWSWISGDSRESYRSREGRNAPDMTVDPTWGPDSGIEWVYVLCPAGLWVLQDGGSIDHGLVLWTREEEPDRFAVIQERGKLVRS